MSKVKISVIGNIAIDIVSRIEDTSNNNYQVEGSEKDPGGRAFNQAVMVARLGGDDVDTSLMGAVGGKDDVIVHALKAAHVDPYLQAIPGVETDYVDIHIKNDGVQTFGHPLASRHFNLEKMEHALARISESKAVLATLGIPFSNIALAFDKANESGAITFLRPAPTRYATWVFGTENIACQNILKKTDYLFIEQGELKAVLGTDDPDAVIGLLEFVKKGVFLEENGIPRFFYTPDKHYELTHQSKTKDSTSALDTFIAAFAVKCFDTDNFILNAIRYALVASLRCAEEVGAFISLPHRLQVETAQCDDQYKAEVTEIQKKT